MIRVLGFIASLWLVLNPVSLFAVPSVWTNANGNNDWSDPANWNPSGVPSSSDEVIFKGTYDEACTIDKDIDVKGITIKASYSATITQQNGQVINIGDQGYTQKGGNFVGGDQKIDIKGPFTLQGGSFKSTSAVLWPGHKDWGGNGVTVFEQSGGSFQHNNGTVHMAPSSWSNRTHTVITEPSMRFYDLVLDADIGSYLRSGAGDTVRADNDLTHKSGKVQRYFAFDGDLTIGPDADGGPGWLIFMGSAGQNWSYSAAVDRTAGIGVDKSSGKAEPKSGTTELHCTRFKLDGGTFKAPSGEMRIERDWSGNSVTVFEHLNGDWQHNNGTVSFFPKGWGSRVYTVDLLPGDRFYDVRVDVGNKNNTKLRVPSGDTLYTKNDLDLEDGRCNGGSLGAEGDVRVENEFAGGTASLYFLGGNAQNFNLSGANDHFEADVILQKKNDNVTLLSDCVLDRSGQSLSFQKGDIHTNSSNTLVIGDGVTTANASDSSFVNGPMRKVGDDAFSFPVGDHDTTYAPIEISEPAQSTDHFTCEYIGTDPDPPYDDQQKDPTIDHISDCEHWMLDRTNGSSDVTVSLSWEKLRSCTVDSLDDLVVARWNGSKWKDHGQGGQSGNAQSGMVWSSSDVSNFSPFTLASVSGANPLPVELLELKADPVKGDVQVRWKTMSEKKNDHYVVERSEMGDAYEKLEKIEGAGNSNSVNSYVSVDENPYSGTSYYRLRQVDMDGASKVYGPVAVDISKATETVKIGPNPLHEGNDLILRYGAESEQELRSIAVHTIKGELVQRETDPGSIANGQGYRMDLDLATGSYMISLHTSSGRVQRKLLVR